MNSEVIKLLRETSANFAMLADAFEEEQRAVRARLDHMEHSEYETRQALRDLAHGILNRL